MYDTFKEMAKDLFDNEDFVQYCYINGFKYRCIVSSIDNGMQYTIAGLVDTINFTLDILIADNPTYRPKENDKIIFREEEYKVAATDIDSALATMKIYMISDSRGK